MLYRLNVNRLVLRHMGVGHVYSDPAFLDGSRLREKLAVTRAPGARFASVRFVTGHLDRSPAAGRFSISPGTRRARFWSCTVPKRRRGRAPRWSRWPRCRAFTASSLSAASLTATLLSLPILT